MTNPFDRFDEPAAGANPFDRFDQPEGPLKFKRPGPSGGDSTMKRSAAGAAMGVADIGHTLLKGLTYLPGKISPAVAQWQRTMDADFEALTEQNADNTAFKVGRVGGNVAATLPVGGAMARGLSALPMVARTAPGLVNAVRTGGFVTGSAPTTAAGRLADMGVRAIGGGATGAASAALVNPEDATAGGVIGAVLPGAARLGGTIGSFLREGAENGAQRLMQSAIKPTLKQLSTGDADTAVKLMLQYGIMPNMKGVTKLRGMIDDLNTQISDKIAGSTATIDKAKVMTRLDDTKRMFGNQVSPTADLAAIQRVGDDFMAHPNFPGSDIPVQAAQLLKQGTYKTLAKKYGQLGGAETEAQKGLARGLKEEIAGAVPEIAGLNAAEAKMITTMKVAERRALMELNKNPGGLSLLATNPAAMVAFMADRSATFKALAARMVNSSASAAGNAGAAVNARLANPALRNLLVLPGATTLPE